MLGLVDGRLSGLVGISFTYYTASPAFIPCPILRASNLCHLKNQKRLFTYVSNNCSKNSWKPCIPLFSLLPRLRLTPQPTPPLTLISILANTPAPHHQNWLMSTMALNPMSTLHPSLQLWFQHTHNCPLTWASGRQPSELRFIFSLSLLLTTLSCLPLDVPLLPNIKHWGSSCICPSHYSQVTKSSL